MSKTPNSIDPNNGFCSETKIFHSLRPNVSPLPPFSSPFSITHYIFSLLQSSGPLSSIALIDATTSRRISFSELMNSVESLSASLQNILGLSKGQIALIISPNSIHIPILYLSLLSLGVIISPSNPSSSELELLRHIDLIKPSVVFATSKTASKIPFLQFGAVIILDSVEFESMITSRPTEFHGVRAKVNQSDTAAILLSSGTSGKFKGVELTHRNWIYAIAAGYGARDRTKLSRAVYLCAVPCFHVYGLGVCLRAVAMGDTVVTMERFDMREMKRAVEEFGVTHMALAPPVVVAMVKGGKMDRSDLRSVQGVASGGAPLSMSVIRRFKERFPDAQLSQAYGLTETTGRVNSLDSRVEGSTGKLGPNLQAKIVDPDSGLALSPNNTGELWIRGPCIMKGYIGDKEATKAALDSGGWLKTGDLCYIDNEGFLFYVDRIKELIKYKGYQVAPVELEHLLQSHPDIVEAAVAPYPDEEAGQIPIAFVVKRIGSVINESQIMDFISKQVAPYKRIRRVMFVESIPKNAAGKVLRKELIRIVPNATSKL